MFRKKICIETQLYFDLILLDPDFGRDAVQFFVQFLRAQFHPKQLCFFPRWIRDVCQAAPHHFHVSFIVVSLLHPKERMSSLTSSKQRL